MAIGELEQVILLALAALKGEAHGAAIAQELEDRLQRSVAPGALYTVLDRLEGKGFVESWIGESTPSRGGRRRKVYRLCPAGARAMREWYAGIRDLAEGAFPVLDVIAEGAS